MSNNEDEWLRSEFEWAWTTQSDINSRIVTVYTAAMSVSVPLLAAIVGWVLSKESQGYLLNPIGTSLLFLLPNILTLPLFWHNLGQRREIVRVGAYWKILIEGRAKKMAWANRIEKYREIANYNNQSGSLGREANDPIPGSYWIIYLISFSAAILNVFLRSSCVDLSLFMGMLLLFGIVGGSLIYLTFMWKKVLKSDLVNATKLWEQVLETENNIQGKPKPLDD